MAIIPWKYKSQDPLSDEENPRSEFGRELDRLFEAYVHDPWQRAMGSLGATFPAVDVSESDDAVCVRAEIPGVDPDQVDLTVSGDSITIAGEKKNCSEERSKDHYHRSESCYGTFRRTIRLPMAINSEQVTADYKNGVLTIRMQKRQPSKSTKIKVDVTE